MPTLTYLQAFFSIGPMGVNTTTRAREVIGLDGTLTLTKRIEHCSYSDRLHGQTLPFLGGSDEPNVQRAEAAVGPPT